jgi:cyclopropane-fatty-acyl-phospholipid synthase
MVLFSLEQDKRLVVADFAFYGLGVLTLAATTWATLPPDHVVRALASVGVGALGWTLAEYALHRFVLHGVQPFKRWHALHHARPVALIATPTLLTAAGFGLLVLAPAWWLAPVWLASALVLGVLAAYLVYIAMHHAVHHLHGPRRWLRGHQRRHAQHHRAGARTCYGVSTPLWDHVFGSI